MIDAIINHTFLQNALFAGIIASVLCGIIGSYIVIKKNVFIAAGISHLSFGGLGIAYYLNMPPFIGALVFAGLSSIALGFFSHKELKLNDTFIGILWAIGMAIGILFLHITPGYAPDLMSYLFGNILIISAIDLYIMIIIGSVITLLLILFYKEILAFFFDRNFVFIKGMPTVIFNIVVYLLTGFSIVLLIKLVGIILIMALLTIPPSIAMLFRISFQYIIIISIILSVFFVILGLSISYYIDIPSGVAITLPQGIIFVILKIFKKG